MADPGTRPSGHSTVGSREDAEVLLEAVGRGMSVLADLLDREAEDVAAGRVTAGLSREGAKQDATAAYLRGLEAVKANAVALVRFAPDGLAALRASQDRLQETALRNGAVLATARAVSEGLLKSLSDELARAARPLVYASGGRMTEPPRSGAPMSVSRLY